VYGCQKYGEKMDEEQKERLEAIGWFLTITGTVAVLFGTYLRSKAKE